MSFSKVILVCSIGVFSLIGVLAFIKNKTQPVVTAVAPPQEKIEKTAPLLPKQELQKKEAIAPLPEENVDRIERLFMVGPNKLPIVETVTYSALVPWLKGRQAWVADYASYYHTSRHFIARSLNGKPDYSSQNVQRGSRFNVFRNERPVEFYLVIDLSQCKMRFYYLDLTSHERVLLKTYRVGLGRLQQEKPSGSLTPLGTYKLGSKIALYKPGVMGYFQEKKSEMIQIFGTRWIPFEEEIEGCTAPAKGFGIHGAPWKKDPQTGELIESRECIGQYDSDGCIRLALEDMEELFAIVITKPTFVQIVKNASEATTPGLETNL